MTTTETSGVDLRTASRYQLNVAASRLHLSATRRGDNELARVAGVIHAGQWLTADDLDGLPLIDLLDIATLLHRIHVDLALDLTLVVGSFDTELAREIRDTIRLHHLLITAQGATS